MRLCDYGCGQEAKHQFKNGKWCCSKSSKLCPELIRRSSESRRGTKRTLKQIKNISESHIGQKSSKKGKTYKEIYGLEKAKLIKEKMSKNKLLTIKKIKEKYSFLYKIEEFRENSITKQVEVHCKNHKCENSKEKGGWFVPTYTQIYERHRALTKPAGFEDNNFYCCQECKDSCLLYGLQHDPYKNTGKAYTPGEKEVFDKLVLKRDNEICYYCSKHHATIVHHLRPHKLEPFFALDPDYAVSVCKKCHYKYGHPTGSKYSTGNLAKIVCSVESQKFLEQKIN